MLSKLAIWRKASKTPSKVKKNKAVASGRFKRFTSVFGNLSINTKITISSLLMLAIMGALSALSWNGLHNTAAAVETFSKNVAIVDSAHDIDREFVAYRNAIREYMSTGDDLAYVSVDMARNALDAAISSGLERITRPDLHEKIVTLAENISFFSKNFDEMNKTRLRQSKTIKEKIKPLTAKLHQNFEYLQGNKIALSQVASGLDQLSKVSIAVTILSGRYVEDVATEADAAVTEFTNLIPSLEWIIEKESDKKLVKEVQATSEEFAAAYKQVRDDAQNISKIFEQMKSDSEMIAAMASNIKETGKTLQVRTAEDTRETVSKTKNLIFTLAAGGMIAGLLLSVLIGRGISRPIVAMCAAMRELANGNFDVVLPGLGRKDEVGQMASAVEEFKKQAVLKAEREAAEREEINRIEERARKAELVKFADQFEAAVGSIVRNVSSSASELESAAGVLTTTADTTQDLSGVVANVSDEASANVQSVASATEELSTSIAEIGRQVQESTMIAGDAVSQVERTNSRITELSQTASRVGDVVKLITAIAEQTNLLALNATIEAARAGDAGRGFAVVAQEVKALATQTAKATEEISQQIGSMQSATQESVGAISAITNTIGRIAQISTTIAAAVEEQGAATQEIARNVQHVAEGTREVATNIANVNRGATETGAASNQVLNSAKNLSTESERLREELDNFMRNMRAA